MLYPQLAKHLLNFIKRYTGIPRGAKINIIYVIEEMSHIIIRLEEDPTGSC